MIRIIPSVLFATCPSSGSPSQCNSLPQLVSVSPSQALLVHSLLRKSEFPPLNFPLQSILVFPGNQKYFEPSFLVWLFLVRVYRGGGEKVF